MKIKEKVNKNLFKKTTGIDIILFNGWSPSLDKIKGKTYFNKNNTQLNEGTNQ